MVDLNKYTFNGWGLSEEAFETLEQIVESENITEVLEFGSGQSTYFLNDLNLNILSFDDNIDYSAKVEGVVLRDLISVSDSDFNKIINNKISFYDVCQKYDFVKQKHSKQKNCFYKLNSEDIKEKYQLIILDGPNGNGRSIAFNVIQNKIKYPSYILIDDYDHYPFIEHFNNFFPNNELVFDYKESGTNQCFRIYKILENE